MRNAAVRTYPPPRPRTGTPLPPPPLDNLCAREIVPSSATSWKDKPPNQRAPHPEGLAQTYRAMVPKSHRLNDVWCRRTKNSKVPSSPQVGVPFCSLCALGMSTKEMTLAPDSKMMVLLSFTSGLCFFRTQGGSVPRPGRKKEESREGSRSHRKTSQINKGCR